MRSEPRIPSSDSTSPTDAPRSSSRRRALSLLGGAAALSLGGCLGGSSSRAEAGTPASRSTGAGAAAGPNSAGAANSATAAATEPQSATATRTPPTDAMISAEDFDCETMGASMPMERYASEDRPFVFTFERPSAWFMRGSDTPSTDAVSVTAPVEVPTGGYLFEIGVAQYFKPVAEDALEQYWSDGWKEAGTVDFGGQERRIVEMPSGDSGRYILSVVVPDASTATYRQVTVDGQTLSFDEGCYDNYRAVGDAVVQSLRPK